VTPVSIGQDCDALKRFECAAQIRTDHGVERTIASDPQFGFVEQLSQFIGASFGPAYNVSHVHGA